MPVVPHQGGDGTLLEGTADGDGVQSLGGIQGQDAPLPHGLVAQMGDVVGVHLHVEGIGPLRPVGHLHVIDLGFALRVALGPIGAAHPVGKDIQAAGVVCRPLC